MKGYDYMIKIYKNPNGDTRTAKKDVTFKEFQEANDSHIRDVGHVMEDIGNMIQLRGWNHDYTKKMYSELFYDNFLSTMNNGTDFVNDNWYQLHIKEERHTYYQIAPMMLT
jgi:hypothetical protein